MVEQELAAVEQSPEDVFEPATAIVGSGEDRVTVVDFFVGWPTAERDEVEFGKRDFIRSFRLDES